MIVPWLPVCPFREADKVGDVGLLSEAAQVLKPLGVDKVVESDHRLQLMPAFVTSILELKFPRAKSRGELENHTLEVT